jgi:hydrogenase maturation protease
MRDVTIVGIGSTLMGDDGIGVRAAERLREAELPGGVRVVASGLIGVDLVYELEELEAAVIIDAADFRGEPGEIKVASPDQIEDLGIERLGAAHSIGLAEALTMLKLTGADPVIRLVCVQPKDVSPREALSPELEARLAAVCDAALEAAIGLRE